MTALDIVLLLAVMMLPFVVRAARANTPVEEPQVQPVPVEAPLSSLARQHAEKR